MAKKIRISIIRPIVGVARGNPAAGARMAAVNRIKARVRARSLAGASAGIGRRIIMQKGAQNAMSRGAPPPMAAMVGRRAAMMAPQGMAAQVGAPALAQHVGRQRLGRFVTTGT